jgi:phosphatidylserine/phosphatidylglycerophosphate/cardiolipin synthase-like enzyme
VTVEWLVDNADTYDTIVHSIQSARRSLWIAQLAFDADCVAHDRVARAGVAQSVRRAGGTLLAEAVLSAALRAPVDVRILLNATLLLDTSRSLRRYFVERLAAVGAGRGSPPGAIEVRGVSRFPQLLHAKMIVVDGTEAFLLGSPFANGYWDDPSHPPVDSRRPIRELGGRTVNDLSVRLTGTPVAALERVFETLWSAGVRLKPDKALATTESAQPASEPAVATERRPTTAVRIVCTAPRRALPSCPAGSTEIIDELLAGIERARSCIYIEHQYLSARPIVTALANALRRLPGLELIAVLNQNADVTAYRRWQNRRLVESGLLKHPRAGLFALWTVERHAAGNGASMLNQVFVHSKAVVVDDEWATAGSANLDGVSLHSYGDDFTARLGRRIFRHVRNFEVNVVVDEAADRAAQPGIVAALRARLWSEHLGTSAGLLGKCPPGGWLPLWRAQAAANVAALAADAHGTGAQMSGFVLPYSAEATPRRQLADVGVDPDPARLDVRFDPGWLEVHFSPNWVRNMFS